MSSGGTTPTVMVLSLLVLLAMCTPHISSAGQSEECPSPQFLELGVKETVQCSFDGSLYVAWYNSSDTTDPIIQIRDSIKSGHGYESREYDIHPNGSLIIHQVTLHHEMTFNVTVVELHSEQSSSFVVKTMVIVYPDPPYPVIEGCDPDAFCGLEVNPEGNLTCALTGVRPDVELEWRAFNEEDHGMITFSNQRVEVIKHPEKSDIILTGEYRIHPTSANRLTVECFVPTSDAGHFRHAHLRSRVYLFFTTVSPTDSVGSTGGHQGSALIPVILVAVLFILLAVSFLTYKRMTRLFREGPYEPDEVTPMMEDLNTEREMKKMFHRELRRRYGDLYHSVKPIPFYRDRLFYVRDLFVDVSLEKLIVTGRTGRSWEKLHSYRNVFVKSSRYILEGHAGYGKSTLALQLVSDWINPSDGSLLNDVEVVILLQGLQLDGVDSVVKAIRRKILPKDSTLDETDIKTILTGSRSVMIILDGIEELDGGVSHIMSDIMGLLDTRRDMDTRLLITTRPSGLSLGFAADKINRIRLTGIEEATQLEYLHRVVVDGDSAAAQQIMKNLRENVFISEFCRVPFIFAIYAHISDEIVEKRLNILSVTNFSRLLVASLCYHLRNKLDWSYDARELDKVTSYEQKFEPLSKIAFEGLAGERREWTKEEFDSKVGQGLADHYEHLGILKSGVKSDTGQLLSGSRIVRFQHDQLQEWYAAHYLSKRVDSSEDECILKDASVIDAQYLFRMASRLSKNARDKIVQFSRDVLHDEMLALLCTFEDSDKLDFVKTQVQETCSNAVKIQSSDAKLRKSSAIQLLGLASAYQIPISSLHLRDCFSSVELTRKEILLDVKLRLPAFASLVELHISQSEREFTRDEIGNIFEFCENCQKLETLRFESPSLPPQVETQCPGRILEGNIRVSWCTDGTWYRLNTSTGGWHPEV